MIKSAKLQGHGAAVLCLDASSPSSSSQDLACAATVSSPLLLSGSEDGTARLWDLRDHRRRACLCIRVPGGGDVLSAVFAPPFPAAAAAEDAATTRSECDGFAKDCSVYLGVENTVLEYDLRHAESPIVFSQPTRNWGNVLQNQDEVNQIGLINYNKIHSSSSNNSGGKKKKNQKRKGGKGSNKSQQVSGENTRNSLYLAACDDAGKARWTEAWSPPPEPRTNDSSDGWNYDSNCGGSSTILHHDNHGVAVVPTCAFRPCNTNHNKRGGGAGNSLELVTGGTDCKIQLWDLFRPKKPVSTFTICQNINEEGQSKPQVCNPPFIYSLAWSKDGKSLAAGLGDGTVAIFEINNRTLVQSHVLVGNEDTVGTMHYAHESSVASVVYPSFSGPTSDRVLCSSGSDGAIVFWDLGEPNDEQWNHISNDSDTDCTDSVAKLFPPTVLRELRNDAAAESYKNGTPSTHQPKMLFDISHGQKINWVTPAVPLSDTSSSTYNDTIFVADTSPDITSYTIPFQT
mmetsp:Transcript_9442/g.23173  ORF Transcript_9442/g.23173 Transcript_9442/m.23173 type:complete len:514 (+) Transcript_9442:143-1684(+)|eukprot:CAMPEP_0197187146 /NCGR_PEP_ID=MMETSP1423-20130617/15321_1 /TAXON_ID=476441 /ORGANISM="Pseudo-nitzschia heimii, Strain UNC1101" /LENGTH=513 /DNA_ID=CAMNT_0042638647 /DNA_START=65 /DNA_END=1606 /DNA_ORIENTATION=-